MYYVYIYIYIYRYRPGVAQRVGRGIALLFHDHGTRRGWVVSSTSRPHFTPGKDPVPILQESGWAPGPVWTCGKSRPHRDSIPDRPASSQSVYRLSYPAHIYIYVCILFWVLDIMYLNSWRWSIRPKHVVYIDNTNKICCGWQQHIFQFEYDVPRRDEFYQKLLLKIAVNASNLMFALLSTKQTALHTALLLPHLPSWCSTHS